jgi:hypothetical protein
MELDAVLTDVLCREYGQRAGIYYWGLLKAKTDTSRRQLCSHTTRSPTA